MANFRRQYHQRFGQRRGRDPVTVAQKVQKRRGPCRGCGLPIEAGDPCIRMSLAKRYRVPCAACHQSPAKVKRFHLACKPADVNAAMGYNPQSPTSSVTEPVAPPPRPPTFEELAFAALCKIEEALVTRARAKGVTSELEAAFKTYQGIKARALRPGTPQEGEVALSLALQRAVKLVF